MGGGGGQSTSTVSIPPQVLARYDVVNDIAQQTAQAPFQYYGGEFVAPLTDTQQYGIANTNAAANMAQPYYQAATNNLMGAQAQAQPYVNAATMGTVGAAQQGQQYLDAATQGTLGAAQQGQQYLGAATQGTMGAAQQGQQYLGAATGLAGASAYDVNAQPLNVSQYISPYLQNVAASQMGLLNQQFQQAQSGQLGQAIQSGAFGGDRSGIAAANLQQQQSLAANQELANILNTGYNTALGAAQQQQGVNLASEQANRANLQAVASQLGALGQQGYAQQLGAAGQLGALGQQGYAQQLGAAGQLGTLGQQGYAQGLGAANQLAGLGQQEYAMGANTANQLATLGAGSQGAALQGAQAQLAAGQIEQANRQARDTALYNQFLQAQSYPFQTAQFLANIAEGTGSLSGSTTSTQTTQNGIFSDERLKEDVRPVGKTYDGQNIYSYRYKGDPKTHIGLMAQEVEAKHPEAVGLAGGYKTVDYDKATDKAAERGHFAGGGLAGYTGGFDPSMANAILANYENIYAPLLGGSGAAGIGGGLGAASGRVPVGAIGNYSLHAAPAASIPQAQNPITQGADISKSLNQIKQTAKDLNLSFGKRNQQPGLLAGTGYGQQRVTDAKPLTMPDVPDLSTVAQDVPDLSSSAPDLNLYGDASLPAQGADISDFGNAYRGGRIYRASGGNVDVYQDTESGPSLDIPDTQGHYTLNPAPAAGSKAGGGGDTVGGLLQGIAAIAPFFLKTGGRVGYAEGGGIDDDLYIDNLLEMLRSQNSDQSDESNSNEFNNTGAPVVEHSDSVEQSNVSAAPALGGLNPSAVAAPKQSNRGGLGGVRSVRNNNPGNIEDGSFAKSMPGYAGSDGRFAIFNDPQSGRAAQMALIKSYLHRGYNTPLAIANRWANGSEKGNNPKAYARVIAQQAGVGLNDKLSGNEIAKIANAQTIVEGGSKALSHFVDGFASGGLVGRNGYAVSGFVNPTLGDGGSDGDDSYNGYNTNFVNPTLGDGGPDGDDSDSDSGNVKQPTDLLAGTGYGQQRVTDAKPLTMPDVTDLSTVAQNVPGLLAGTGYGQQRVTDAKPLTMPDVPDLSTVAQYVPDLSSRSAVTSDTPQDRVSTSPNGSLQAINATQAGLPMAVIRALSQDPAYAQMINESMPDYYGSGKTITDTSFGDQLKHGKTDAVLSVLAGLSAAATAPTRNPLYALASGLGAGVQAYQGQRQFENERAQTAQNLALNRGRLNVENYLSQIEGGTAPYQRLAYAGKFITGGLPGFSFQPELPNPETTDPKTGAALHTGMYVGPANALPNHPSPLYSPTDYRRVVENALSQFGFQLPGMGAQPTGLVPGQPAATTPPAPVQPSGVSSAGPSTAKQRPAGAAPLKPAPYSADAVRARIVSPYDDSVLPEEDRLASLQARRDWTAQNDPHGKDAVEQLNNRIIGYQDGSYIPKDKYHHPYTGYYNYFQDRERAESQVQALQKETSDEAKNATEWPNVSSTYNEALNDIINASTGRAPINSKSHVWGDAASYIRSLPDPVRKKAEATFAAFGLDPKSLYTTEANSSLVQKNAVLAGLGQALNLNVGKQAQAPLEKQLAGIESSGTGTPDANYIRIIDQKAKLAQQQAWFNAFSKARTSNPGFVDTPSFKNDWFRKNPIDKFVSQAAAQTPMFTDVRPSTLKQFSKIFPTLNPTKPTYVDGAVVRNPKGALFVYKNGKYIPIGAQ